MSVSELQEYTFRAKYAQWIPEKKRRENWGESVDRYCDMFLDKYPDKDILKYVDRVRKSIKKKRVLGSQRGLQFGGKATLKKNLRIYNCLFSYVDRAKFFQECMYGLMCGCGFGYSVQKHHVAKLPGIVAPTKGKKKYVIPDSIEGWADAVGILVNSYFEEANSVFPEYAGYTVQFDYSEISPKGTLLSSCYAKAPGPEPLKKSLEHVRDVLNNALKFWTSYSEPVKLTPLQCHDIICYFSDAVVSGGVRRSALIALFSPDDTEMVMCKTGNWLNENPQRGRANNSVVLLKSQANSTEFAAIMESVKQFGEPGFVFVDNLEHGVNPCCEISFYAYDELGRSGVQGCNLSTINAGKIKTKADFFRACRDAAILGTLQAGFTDFSYLGPISESIFKREALLGVSMTGIMECPEVCLDAETQRQGAEIVKRTNRKLAKILGINPAARTTCCKPEGTTSCVLGTSSGIHPHHAKRYIRRVQANVLEEVYQHFKKTNPLACERSVWCQNNTTDVISFCIEVRAGAKLKNQISAIQMLESVKLTQQNWVIGGRNLELCSQPWLQHNVSNTITVKDDEWDDVTKFIYENREYFCGISLLPASGDKDYPQAPFTEVFLPSELVAMYGDASLFASGLIEKGKELWDDNLWEACTSILSSGSLKSKAKIEFVEKAKRYAERYLDGDLKKLTYCLKDVDTWKYYIDLKREYKNVDYEVLTEEVDNTTAFEEAACGNGLCELK
jgi:ribonucleoside-triphosphate reductase (thioredoxin)